MKIIAPIRLLAFLILVSVIIPLNAQVLDVIITDIRNTDGRLCIAIFDNNLDYQNETALLTAYIDKETLLSDTAHIEIPIWPGTFGISVLDDEDGDEKMRFSFWAGTFVHESALHTVKNQLCDFGPAAGRRNRRTGRIRNTSRGRTRC